MIGGLLPEAAKRFGDQIALICSDEQLSFRDIEERAAAFAGGLLGMGVENGARVVLHLPNGWRWIVAYYAIARLGAVVVPANILLSNNEVAYMANDAGADVIICPASQAVQIAAGLSGEIVDPLFVTANGASVLGVDFGSLLDAAPIDVMPAAPEDLFTIGYTSGTTGKPKGAMLTHQNIFMGTALTATVHLRRQGDVILSALPLPHVYGNIVMNTAFMCGMTLVTMEKFEASKAIALIAQHRVTLFEGVPTMYYYLLAEPSLAGADVSSLTRCTVGGQTMPTASIEAVEAALGCPLLELWGMTEVGGPAVSHSPYLKSHHGSIGLAFPGMQAKVVDIEDPSRELPAGEVGELLIRGPLLMKGYYRNEAATRAAIGPEGWMRTGDIARREIDDYLYIVDRKNDLIITAGYNVYPAELEQVIAQHPAVSMVAVAGVHDDAKGQLAKAFIVLRAGASVTAEEIVSHCRLSLASYKVPRVIEFVADLPKTSTGKILRRVLANNGKDKVQA